MKKFLVMVLCVCLIIFNFSSCGLIGLGAIGLVSCIGEAAQNDEQEFYDLVYESKELLDIVGDDIYNYWYDCIYYDAYLDSIDYAIACAQEDNADNIEKIIENDAKIKEKYKDVKDGDCSDEVKDVMQAYNEYYSFVIEVSGSFNTYSASKETLKKNLATALKNLSFELD